MTLIEEIKQRLDVMDVVSERVTLRKAGRLFKGLCPFHEEKTPSFMVDPRKGRFRCYGCGAHGDVIDFVAAIRGLNNKEAIRHAADLAGVRPDRPTPEETARMRREREARRIRKLCHGFSHAVERGMPRPRDPELLSAWDVAYDYKDAIDQRAWRDGGPRDKRAAAAYLRELQEWRKRWELLLSEANGDSWEGYGGQIPGSPKSYTAPQPRRCAANFPEKS